MEEFFSHPAVQGGVAPFVVGLVLAGLLYRLRLGGLALIGAFFTAVYFVAGFALTPLTATRKIFLLSLAAPVVGILVDFAFKPTRLGGAALSVAGAACALWVFWPLLADKQASEAWLQGGTITVSVAFLLATGTLIATDSIRSGSSGLALGLGAGITAILGASATYGLYGIALGAGAGAFLLVQMLTGKKCAAGATFMLPATFIAGLLGAGAMMLAKVPWHALLVLALIPLATSLPAPRKAPVWAQAVLLSLYGFVAAGIAFFLSWHSGSATPG